MALSQGFARFHASPFVRLFGFFLIIGVVMVLVVRLFPAFEQMVTLNLGGSGAAQQFQNALSSQPTRLPPIEGIPGWLVAALAIVGGLLFSLPVAWTYTVTKRREGYDKAVVQMIVMLPVAVSAVVLVVFNDLALAFALAGIVAAVRFRTTLKDVKDAVFAFVAIGIGLASGVQSWALAGVLSLTFSVLALVLWKFEVGEDYPDFRRRGGPLPLSDALAPGGDEPAVRVGDEDLTAPLAPGELDRLADRAERLAEYVRADAMRQKGKYRELLVVHAADGDRAREEVDGVLEEHAKRWQLVERFPGRKGTSVLEYLVRLKKQTDIGDVLDELLGDGDGAIRAVELKSVKGLRKLLT